MMRTGVTISSIGHAAILGWSVLTFAAKPNEAKPIDAMPVDIISATELSQLTAGARNTAKVETPKPMVEKLAERSKNTGSKANGGDLDWNAPTTRAESRSH